MTMTTHDSNEALATAGHHHTVQVAIGPPHMQTEYLCWLVVCQDVASWASCYWSSLFVTCLCVDYHHSTTIPYSYNYSASCTSGSREFVPVGGRKLHLHSCNLHRVAVVITLYTYFRLVVCIATCTVSNYASAVFACIGVRLE